MKFLFFSQRMQMRGKVHAQVVSVRRIERCSRDDGEKPLPCPDFTLASCPCRHALTHPGQLRPFLLSDLTPAGL